MVLRPSSRGVVCLVVSTMGHAAAWAAWQGAPGPHDAVVIEVEALPTPEEAEVDTTPDRELTRTEEAGDGAEGEGTDGEGDGAAGESAPQAAVAPEVEPAWAGQRGAERRSEAGRQVEVPRRARAEAPGEAEPERDASRSGLADTQGARKEDVARAASAAAEDVARRRGERSPAPSADAADRAVPPDGSSASHRPDEAPGRGSVARAPAEVPPPQPAGSPPPSDRATARAAEPAERGPDERSPPPPSPEPTPRSTAPQPPARPPPRHPPTTAAGEPPPGSPRPGSLGEAAVARSTDGARAEAPGSAGARASSPPEGAKPPAADAAARLARADTPAERAPDRAASPAPQDARTEPPVTPRGAPAPVAPAKAPAPPDATPKPPSGGRTARRGADPDGEGSEDTLVFVRTRGDAGGTASGGEGASGKESALPARFIGATDVDAPVERRARADLREGAGLDRGPSPTARAPSAPVGQVAAASAGAAGAPASAASSGSAPQEALAGATAAHQDVPVAEPAPLLDASPGQFSVAVLPEALSPGPASSPAGALAAPSRRSARAAPQPLRLDPAATTPGSLEVAGVAVDEPAPPGAPALAEPPPLVSTFSAPLLPLDLGQAPTTAPDPEASVEARAAAGLDVRALPEDVELSAVATVRVRRHPLGEWWQGAETQVRDRWTWPEELRVLGVEGTVRLAFEVDRRGRVSGARVVAPSGHAELDFAALAALPETLPPPPPGYPRVTMELTFRYGAPGRAGALPG